MRTTTRRGFLVSGGAVLLAVGAGAVRLPFWSDADAAPNAFPVSHPDADWRKRLSSDQYAVLRRKGTERPFSSDLNHEKRAGTFACAGCDQPAFSSSTKFDSGTGWPSFWQPIDGAVGQSDDRSLLIDRTEVHCSRCGGHLGHVFNDGPRPTGLRYCMNGVALTFKTGAA